MNTKTITIYVPIKYLNEVANGNKPKTFWTQTPNTWNKNDVAEVSIPLDVYMRWSTPPTGPTLLKG